MSIIRLKNNALDNLTSFEGSASLGDMVFISSATASSSASIEFSLGSLKEYKFFFVNIHPSVDNAAFEFQTSIDSGSNYGVTLTSTAFRAYHIENDTAAALEYQTSNDLAQSTSFQYLQDSVGNDNDQSCAGYLTLFNPSSTTYVKHFLSNTNRYAGGDYSINIFNGGYFNTISALTNIKFQFSSGNIDDGKILLFGIN